MPVQVHLNLLVYDLAVHLMGVLHSIGMIFSSLNSVASVSSSKRFPNNALYFVFFKALCLNLKHSEVDGLNNN